MRVCTHIGPLVMLCLLVASGCLTAADAPAPAGDPAASAAPVATPVAPFPYVWSTAYHILPETTTDESGYFSLCEGLDGTVYVGTAAYGRNAYLVAWDPKTEQQRIVIDAVKVCGLDPNVRGYAAQAKLHTRNYVGPSGTVYVGSKQGYRRGADDTADYPGGYVMTWDPKAGKAHNLGMPMPGQGVIDVVADEPRDLLYVVTCEEQHWMRAPLKGGDWQEIGPILTPYATTLVDPAGIASAVTKDWQLVQYDPAARITRQRPLLLDGAPWVDPEKPRGVLTWQLAADGHTVYAILMSDLNLYRFDLHAPGDTVAVENLGPLVEGEKPDSRCALTIAPDGRFYALMRVTNTTGFGGHNLHWLSRFDPATGKIEPQGVLTVRNPDFFAFDPNPDAAKAWTHGYYTLPDGTLTVRHNHMGLVAGRDGTLYATILYPYTLLRIDGGGPTVAP